MRGFVVRNVIAMGLAATVLLFGACNTVSGAGKDVSSAGTTVSNAAEDVAH